MENTINNSNLEDVLHKVTNAGISSKYEKPLLGKGFIMANYKNLKYRIKSKQNAFVLELVCPIWITIIGLVITILLGTLIFTLINGSPMIVKGGFIVYLIGFYVGDVAYVLLNKKKLKEFELVLKNLEINIINS